MRYVMLAGLAVAVAIATPVLAAKNQTEAAPAAAPAPDWHDCYDLAWIRGVHTEQGELPDFMDQCLAGTVPFGEDFVRYYGRQEGKKVRG